MKQVMTKHQTSTRIRRESTRESGNRITLIIFVLLPILIILVAIAMTHGLILMIPEWQEPLVIRSAHRNKDAVLIYIPGYDTPAEAYVPLLSQIQSEFDTNDISLKCSILRYPKFLGKEFPPFWGHNALVEHALQQLSVTHDTSVFIGGHSVGGVLAQMVAYRNPTFVGLIVHGAYVMKKYRRQRLPVPTLTLSGTRDGCNRFTHIAIQHNDLQQLYPSQHEYHHHAPALLIEGMNHMQTAGQYKRSPCQDLEATISMKTALRSVAEFSTIFMLQFMNVTVDTTGFQHELERSEDRFFRPYIQAVEQDENGKTCVLAQQLHLETQEMDIVAHPSSNKIAFIFGKPKGSQSHVQVKTFCSKAFTWFGRSSVPQAIQTLRCKMITKEQLFGETSREFDSCASINAYIFNEALTSLEADLQDRYSKAETGWEFGEDIETVTGPSWLSHELEVSVQNANLMLVQSPRLKTAVGDGRYSGKLYCALVSMSKAYEHILIDAFRKPSACEEDLVCYET